MRIDVLYIADCPNWQHAVQLTRNMLAGSRITDVELNLTEIRTSAEAAEYRFAGSPTILVDGVDVVPGAAQITDVACRVYRDGERLSGLPTVESLRRALGAETG